MSDWGATPRYSVTKGWAEYERRQTQETTMNPDFTQIAEGES